MGTIAILQELGVERRRVEDEALAMLPGWKIRWATEPGSVAERARGAEVVVTVNERVDAGALEAVRPRMVAVSFTGTDHVDLMACRRLGIAVANVPAYATASVAELAVGAIIALVRDFAACDRSVRAGSWRTGIRGVELDGKTVGIVGTGRIGTAVAKRLAPFGCRILGTARRPSRLFAEAGGTHVALEDLLRESDVVTLHVPLGEGTRHLMGERELTLMRPGAFLVNTARGPVVETQALVRALESGRLGGAAIDVYDAEPVPAGALILSAPRTLLLPHVGFATAEALERKMVDTIENIRAFLGGERRNRVEAPR